MGFLTASEIAKKWNISERSVRNYCQQGRVKGAELKGKTWIIPEDAEKPERAERKEFSDNPLLNRLKEGYITHNNGTDNVSEETIHEFDQRFLEAINDNLNMPQAMSIVWEVVKYQNKSKKLAELLKKFDKVLGLDIDKTNTASIMIPEKIIKLAEERNDARKNKQWQKSDDLRDEIMKLGYQIKDTTKGYEITKI